MRGGRAADQYGAILIAPLGKNSTSTPMKEQPKGGATVPLLDARNHPAIASPEDKSGGKANHA